MNDCGSNAPCFWQRENVQFTEPNMWPPNSRDLNPVHYAIWGALQQMVYHRQSVVCWRTETNGCRNMAETTAIVHRQQSRMASSSGLRSATEWRTHWTHVQLTCKVLILSTCFVVWVCFVRLVDVLLFPFVTYYGYCHSLDGTTLFSKVDSNKLRFNVKNEMTLICA